MLKKCNEPCYHQLRLSIEKRCIRQRQGKQIQHDAAETVQPLLQWHCTDRNRIFTKKSSSNSFVSVSTLVLLKVVSVAPSSARQDNVENALSGVRNTIVRGKLQPPQWRRKKMLAITKLYKLDRALCVIDGTICPCVVRSGLSSSTRHFSRLLSVSDDHT